MVPSTRRILAIFIGLVAVGLTFANVLASFKLYQRFKNQGRDDVKSYTYRGDDYPEFYTGVAELGELPTVAMVMEESRHYSIMGEYARQDWASGNPIGLSYVRLGPEYRAFGLAMFHELHCLQYIRLALFQGRHETDHIHHCLNYLRQFIQCNPNLTLEPADVLDRDFEMEREGSVHVCLDWTQIYREMEVNWVRWKPVRDAFKENHTLPLMG